MGVYLGQTALILDGSAFAPVSPYLCGYSFRPYWNNRYTRVLHKGNLCSVYSGLGKPAAVPYCGPVAKMDLLLGLPICLSPACGQNSWAMLSLLSVKMFGGNRKSRLVMKPAELVY